MGSKAFDEFVMNRCEEILEESKEFNEAIEEIELLVNNIMENTNSDMRKKMVSLLIAFDKKHIITQKAIYKESRNDSMSKVS